MKRLLLCLLIGIVFVDAPPGATFSVFVDIDAMTGRIQNSDNVNYITTRNALVADVANADNATDIVGQAYSSSTWSVYRTVFRFDTSGLADDATIDSVLVKIVPGTVNADAVFFTKLVAAQDTMAVGYFGVETFINFEGWAVLGAYSPTVLSDSLRGDTAVEGDTLTYRLNTAGKGEISKTGTTQFFLLSGKDIGSLDPKAGAEPSYYEDFLIEDDSMYLQVYYNGTPPSAYARKVNETTPASVNEISAASIKSVNEVQ